MNRNGNMKPETDLGWRVGRKIGIADLSHLEREERAAKAERLEGRCLSDKDEKRET